MNGLKSWKQLQLCKDLEQDSSACKQAITQLQEYFAGARVKFTVPLNPQGSSFCQRVWNSLLAIPAGRTKSYKEIACELGNAQAARAVGYACAHNPIPFFIPCHRVVGANGQLNGYLGNHQEIKKFLLDLETHEKLTIHC